MARQDASPDGLVLTAAGIQKSYRRNLWSPRNRVQVLSVAEIALERGEVVGLVGDNGSGKSTPADTALVHQIPELQAGVPGGVRLTWNAVTALVGVVMGLLPHLLHHVGMLGGAVLVTGATGNVLFAVQGLVLSLPLLRRLYRRFGNWHAPALALATSR